MFLALTFVDEALKRFQDLKLFVLLRVEIGKLCAVHHIMHEMVMPQDIKIASGYKYHEGRFVLLRNHWKYRSWRSKKARYPMQLLGGCNVLYETSVSLSAIPLVPLVFRVATAYM